MKKVTIILAGLAFLAPSVASAKGILPMPTVRKQILVSAKKDTAWNGTRPSLRLKYSNGGKLVQASIYTMSRFAGPPTPLPQPRRMIQATASFRLSKTSEGTLATPIRQNGQVWAHMLRALYHAK